MNVTSIIKAGLAAAFSTILAFSSCKNQEVPGPAPEPDIYYAKADSLQEPAYHKTWKAGESISVFSKTAQNREFRFSGADGAGEGSFDPVSEAGTAAELGANYAASPYRAGNSITEAGVLSLSLPAEQSYVRGGTDPEAQLLAATSQDHYFCFQTLGCPLGISLKGADVKVSSITIKGNADELLAGTMEVSFGKAIKGSIAAHASTSVTLTAREPESLNADSPTVFWVILPKMSLPQGLSYTVTDADGKIFNERIDSTITLGDNAVMLPSADVETVNAGAPDQLGFYPQYHNHGTPMKYAPGLMQCSVFEANGKLWARFLEIGTLSIYQIGPIPENVKAGDLVETSFTLTVAGQEESNEQLQLQVLSLEGGILTLTDGDDNYYVVRI